MANHYKCKIDYPEELYDLCDELGTFKYMIPYPCLLLKWQQHHPKDVIRIATIASHRLNKHEYCESPEKCYTVEKFLNDYGITTV